MLKVQITAELIMQVLTQGSTTDAVTVTEGLPKGASLAEARVDKPEGNLVLFFSEEQEGGLVEQSIVLTKACANIAQMVSEAIDDQVPDGVPERLAELDLIDELVIFAANPEPESDERNIAVQLQNQRYRGGRTFFGPTRLDCLQQALAYYEEHRP